MKTNSQQDPLDQKIDALLTSRPLQVSDDFTARVMAAAEEDTARRSTIRKIIPFALPIAAAIVIAATTWTQMLGTAKNSDDIAPLSMAEAEEIFILEDSLAALVSSDDSGLRTGSLLATLDSLYTEI